MKLKPGYMLFNYLRLLQLDLHMLMMHNKLEKLRPSIKGSWLDIGAGDQPYKKYFSGADKYLTTNTKRHYDDKGFEAIDSKTTYWIEDGTHLPLADKSLDGVACFQVLSVIEKPSNFFREINRVLKPGGRLILTTDFLYPVWSNEDRYRHTAYSLKQLCALNGFEPASIESFGGFGSTIYALFMRYMRSFPDLWKQKSMIGKLLSAPAYLFLLLIIPLASVIGFIVYLIEMSTKSNTGFTFNIMLTAEKIR